MKKARFFLALCVLVGLAAAASAQDTNLIPNRLSYAKVGEWASYKLPGGYTQKLTVVKRFGHGSDALVTVLVENIYDGQVVEAKEITEEAGDAFTSPRVPADPGVFVAVRNDTVKYKDRDYVVSIVEYNRDLGTEDEDVTEWWSNADVPVFGIVKKVENGETAWELSDWGDADGKAKRIVYENGQVKVVDAVNLPADKALPEVDDSIADKARDAVKSVGDATVRAKDAVAEKAAAAAAATSAAAADAKASIAEKASEALKTTGDAAARAKDAVAEKVSAAAKATGDAAVRARDAVADTAAQAGSAIGNAWQNAKEAVTDTASDATRAAGETAADVRDAAGKAADTAADKASAAGESIDRVVDKAKAEIKAEAKAAGEAIDRTVDSLRPSQE